MARIIPSKICYSVLESPDGIIEFETNNSCVFNYVVSLLQANTIPTMYVTDRQIEFSLTQMQLYTHIGIACFLVPQQDSKWIFQFSLLGGSSNLARAVIVFIIKHIPKKYFDLKDESFTNMTIIKLSRLCDEGKMDLPTNKEMEVYYWRAEDLNFILNEFALAKASSDYEKIYTLLKQIEGTSYPHSHNFTSYRLWDTLFTGSTIVTNEPPKEYLLSCRMLALLLSEFSHAITLKDDLALFLLAKIFFNIFASVRTLLTSGITSGVTINGVITPTVKNHHNCLLKYCAVYKRYLIGPIDAWLRFLCTQTPRITSFHTIKILWECIMAISAIDKIPPSPLTFRLFNVATQTCTP